MKTPRWLTGLSPGARKDALQQISCQAQLRERRAAAEPVEELEDMSVGQLEELAEESGLKLTEIHGTGAGGYVRKADLIAAIRASKGAT